MGVSFGAPLGHPLSLASNALGHVDGGTILQQTPAEVFYEIFIVFLVLGTIVGVVVISYVVYNAYKYRDRGTETEVETLTVGELPSGGGGGRKLFVSFAISAIIVVSLVTYAYFALLYIEAGPTLDVGETDALVEDGGPEATDGAAGADDVDAPAAAQPEPSPDGDLAIRVEGYQFGWSFEYPNGYSENNELRVPEGALVTLNATSRDVWHSFGAPELRVKADAIPGQLDSTWFIADEQGEYYVECYELCGVGHSYMEATIVVMEPEEWQQWYEEEAQPEEEDGTGDGDGDGDGGEQVDADEAAVDAIDPRGER